ncbi:MAG: Uncharacterised protein [Flavobacteriia bacterium]|nr:MAG: Uncharacterised protein [Flavobacteriia bacterium]
MTWPEFVQAEQQPTPPYWAAIFISARSEEDEGYAAMDRATIDLAQQIEGFLGYAHAKEQGQGIFISYWASLEAIERWKEDGLHKAAKEKGNKTWYTQFISQVVEIKSHTIKS